ncbi:MAG TPA: hypothetical protein PLM62_04505 [Zoogloea sp.]|nr:hypothetical protein [Zoogloea sp.]
MKALYRWHKTRGVVTRKAPSSLFLFPGYRLAYFSAERAAKSGRVGNQPNPTPPALARKSSGLCGEKRFCKEMVADCAEARYFLNVCGVKQLDGDGDGRPCETLCKP